MPLRGVPALANQVSREVELFVPMKCIRVQKAFGSWKHGIPCAGAHQLKIVKLG